MNIYSKTSGKIATLLIAVLLLTVGSACRRASDNGDIDGMWRIDKIDYISATGETTTVDVHNKFLLVQLELLQLGAPNPVATAVINYKKGSDKIGLDFRTNPNSGLLHGFGIPAAQTVLNIDKCDNKKLILSSEESRIYCTRY